jgi:hypothetical protein
LPEPSEPFSKVCVTRPGDLDCPAPYSDKTLLHTGSDDTRGCADCSCGAAVVASCGGTVRIYGDTVCDGAIADLPADGSSCVVVSEPAIAVTYIPNGLCPPSGGGATGEVKPIGPVTVCCKD